MPTIKTQDTGTIRVPDITIAQLSRGLYRSTATAFKELISNAYDADATLVRIDTNFPEFDFISCVDNGGGMRLEAFLAFFSEEGIGSSIKRKGGKDRSDIYERPLIGRLGIGMLAIGQLCHSFEIESHYVDEESGEGKAYHAEIVLEDEGIPTNEEIVKSDALGTKDIPVGEWQYEIIDFDETKRGFRIYSTDIRKTYLREMRSSLSEKDLNKISFDLADLHKEFFIKAKKSIRDCKPYLETIWELSILCPLPYYGKIDAFPINLCRFQNDDKKSIEYEQAIQLIQERQKAFLSSNFRVIFDGIELKRFIQLPTEKDVRPRLYFIDFEKNVFDEPLKFSGFIFSQIPKAIRPFELNGIQIRLRGVGIGGYDSTFLKYTKQIETIRNKWVSGEIFVDQGLESALNIDRDSFNEHEEHFKALQAVLHEKLDKVFEETKSISKKLSEGKRDKKDEEVRHSLEDIVQEESNGQFKLIQLERDKNAPIVEVDTQKNEIILNTSSRPLKKKKADMLIRAVELAYKISKYTTKTEEERDKLFSKLIKDIFAELV
jgi:hypothetical protein